MTCRAGKRHESAQTERLFRTTFTSSEGAEEGELIAELAKNLMLHTPEEDVYVFVHVNFIDRVSRNAGLAEKTTLLCWHRTTLERLGPKWLRFQLSPLSRAQSVM